MLDIEEELNKCLDEVERIRKEIVRCYDDIVDLRYELSTLKEKYNEIELNKETN